MRTARLLGIAFLLAATWVGCAHRQSSKPERQAKRVPKWEALPEGVQAVFIGPGDRRWYIKGDEGDIT